MVGLLCLTPLKYAISGIWYCSGQASLAKGKTILLSVCLHHHGHFVRGPIEHELQWLGKSWLMFKGDVILSTDDYFVHFN